MTTEQRMEYIERVGEEIITREELRALLEKKAHPIAYDDFLTFCKTDIKDFADPSNTHTF